MDEEIRNETSAEKAKIRCAQILLDLFKEYGAEVLGKNRESYEGETVKDEEL